MKCLYVDDLKGESLYLAKYTASLTVWLTVAFTLARADGREREREHLRFYSTKTNLTLVLLQQITAYQLFTPASWRLGS